jgi:hypothetical protein
MDLLKRYKVVIALVIPILIIVLLRSFSIYHFKDDAAKQARPSVLKTNLITIEKSWTLSGKILLISLDETIPSGLNSFEKSLKIAADSILRKENLNMIRHFKGSVLLYSSDISVASRIWMLLSQMGYKNLYILTSEPDNEILKHNFRPDTLPEPEVSSL